MKPRLKNTRMNTSKANLIRHHKRMKKHVEHTSRRMFRRIRRNVEEIDLSKHVDLQRDILPLLEEDLKEFLREVSVLAMGPRDESLEDISYIFDVCEFLYLLREVMDEPLYAELSEKYCLSPDEIVDIKETQFKAMFR